MERPAGGTLSAVRADCGVVVDRESWNLALVPIDPLAQEDAAYRAVAVSPLSDTDPVTLANGRVLTKAPEDPIPHLCP